MTAYDNDLARWVDAEAAAMMEESGYDMRFVHMLRPAYRQRTTGVWSMCLWDAGQPAGTILAEDWDTLLERLAAFDEAQAAGTLDQWHPVFLEQRHAVEQAHGMRCGCGPRRKEAAGA